MNTKAEPVTLKTTTSPRYLNCTEGLSIGKMEFANVFPKGVDFFPDDRHIYPGSHGGDLMRAARHSACLECSLPLKESEQGQSAACHCEQYEVFESHWFDLGDIELVIATCISLAFIILCRGAWL